MMKRALAGLGLVPAGQLRQLADEGKQMGDRIKSLEDKAAKLRADAETWKQRHDDVAAKSREWKYAAAQATADAERLRGGAEHAKARVAEWKARAEALTGEKLELRARLEDVQRAAISTREYVMATEAKLDVIEAALQVLDTRTRGTAIVRQ